METKQPKKKVKYNITITMGDKVLKGSGTTALEALQSIKRPDKITQKSVFVISQGKLTKTMFFTVQRLKRIFYPKFQSILIKWLAAGLR